MAELECRLAEREPSGLLSEGNRSEYHSAKTGTNVDKNPGTMTEANPQLVSFQGVFGNSDLSIHAVFPISSASSHAFAPMLKETSMCLPTSTCTPPFPVVSVRVSTLPSFSSHDHLSMSASASLFQAMPLHTSTLPVSSLCVIDRSPTFTPSSAFPVGSSHVFTPTSSRVLGNPGFPHTASCVPVPYPNANTFPAHLYTTGPVYTHATQALGSVASTNYTTMFYNTSTGAQIHSPLVEDPHHVSTSFQPLNERFLATITTTLEKMSANQGLPPLEVVKFNVSAEKYPLFRQRFHQMVESKALDEQTKMARLLQFLEGPALGVVQRYEAVPGGLAKSMEVLQNRFGNYSKL